MSRAAAPLLGLALAAHVCEPAAIRGKGRGDILCPIRSLGDLLFSATGDREPVQAQREAGFHPVRGYERVAAGRPRQILTRGRPETGKTRDHVFGSAT